MATSKVTNKSVAKKADNAVHEVSFPVVGIGASAGGLEAFEQFFKHMPIDSGMAFVLIQHLDPTHSSILSQILQRSTNMSVVEAQDQMDVTPNHIYVTPPNRDMAIFHGKLQVNVPSESRSQRLPIDIFMRSLAEDLGENAIGIVLSGNGTDGTLGLRAILGSGGVSLVQSPDTAKFTGMPSSAIQAGYATHILPVEEMPKVLMGDLRRFFAHDDINTKLEGSSISHVLMMLRTALGHDFSEYKKTTITRRIERRMSIHNIERADIYARYLKEHPAELQLLFKELLINVTSFFRDPEVFIELKRSVLPQFLEGKPDDYVFRVWVAGCATGEEAYTIAILLREIMEEAHKEFRTQVYATDLDDEAIATARAGFYLPNIAQDISPERLRRFFIKEENGYRIKKEIREMVVFAVQNVIKDPPFTKLDLLSCRNLMIYLEPVLQNRLIPAFHYSLKPGGVLIVSPSESIGNHEELFDPISRKLKLYRAIHTDVSVKKLVHSGLSWASSGVNRAPETISKKPRELNVSELAKRILLQTYAPASVVTDMQGNILYVHGDTGKYLRPAPGQATLNVIEMAREGLQAELRAAIFLAATDSLPTLNKELSVKSNGSFTVVSFSLRKQASADITEGVLLISFQDVAVEPNKKKPRLLTSETTAQLRLIALEKELANTKETLQLIIEAQQVAVEEMLSSNEEMQSTNEEMQSTNEELETSKEELQSVNEELITVNAELQSKIEQLSDMQNDMKNLLDNINVGIIFLDSHMHIRRFTREATREYRLAQSDVGRHFSDIKTNLINDDLLTHAQNVLETLISFECEMRDINGAWCLARIQPYRSLDNVIDGVVLTFTDITSRLESVAMHEALELAESVVNTVREPLIVLDSTLNVVSVSHSFYRVFKVHSDEVINHSIFELGNKQWDIPELRKLLDNVVVNDDVFDSFIVEHDFPIIGHRKMLLNARRISSKLGHAQLILLAIEDVNV